IRDATDEINTSDLGPISTFGAMTALFFHLCRKKQVDWQVVEVGMGGTNDATNVFGEKDAAVITAISLEHTSVLGNTCEEIAPEKSGIITPGCVTVIASQQDSAVKSVVEKVCGERGSLLIDVAEQFKVRPVAHDGNGQSFLLETK